MRYTPVELRHVKLARALLGYKRDDVQSLVDDVADSFEEVWRERGELADRLEELEKTLEDVKQREALLATTLVAAEKAAAEAIEGAKRKAELIVAEAHQEARSITRAAQSERERLFAEVRRVETLLRAALGMVEEAGASTAEDADPGAWPRKEDTREFEAVSLEDALPLPSQAVEEPPAEPGAPAAAPESGEPWTAGKDFAWG